jgi:LPXTG-motif cell wall-anchored protein
MTGEQSWVWAAVVVVAAIVGLLGWIVWRKGRPFAPGDVFRASRFSAGNHLFPTQVLIGPSSVVQYTPRWIGQQEETIHMAHVASVKVDTKLLFADVLIETSGGSDPIVCHGHTKGDAARMKTLIEGYQTEYYRGGGRPPAGPVAAASSSR